jgi:hypothetical protein
LEDRCVPSTVTWNGNAGDFDFDTAGNWDLNRVPNMNDDAVINTTGITVTHSSGVTDTVHSITSRAGLLLSVGILSLTSGLNMNGAGNLTVASGGTLTVGPSVQVLIGAGQTLTDNGTLTFGTGDAVSFGLAGTTQVVVGNGGVLSASGTTFSASNTTQLTVAAGGHLTASNCTFALSQLLLDNGSVLNPGDLVGNDFNLPLSLPAGYVQDLSGAGGDNLRFRDINILAGSLSSGQTVALNAIGTATTANLRYVFPGALAVQAGATLSVGPNVRVLIQTNQTLTDNGTVTFAAGDAVSFGSSFASTTQIVVGNGGLLNASGTGRQPPIHGDRGWRHPRRPDSLRRGRRHPDGQRRHPECAQRPERPQRQHVQLQQRHHHLRDDADRFHVESRPIRHESGNVRLPGSQLADRQHCRGRDHQRAGNAAAQQRRDDKRDSQCGRRRAGERRRIADAGRWKPHVGRRHADNHGRPQSAGRQPCRHGHDQWGRH